MRSSGSADGAWWVELGALSDPELVGEELVAAIGIRPLPGMSAIEASCMHLAERHALVVLDNCEHLLTACAEAAEGLLHGCPQVSVLATSRTPLGVAGETEWRVPSLSLPSPEPAREPIEALGQSDAVRLFIERARKARPNFAVNNENAAGVAEICYALDGLPLAIELAAARVRMLSVEQIADRSGRSLPPVDSGRSHRAAASPDAACLCGLEPRAALRPGAHPATTARGVQRRFHARCGRGCVPG